MKDNCIPFEVIPVGGVFRMTTMGDKYFQKVPEMSCSNPIQMQDGTQNIYNNAYCLNTGLPMYVASSMKVYYFEHTEMVVG